MKSDLAPELRTIAAISASRLGWAPLTTVQACKGTLALSKKVASFSMDFGPEIASFDVSYDDIQSIPSFVFITNPS